MKLAYSNDTAKKLFTISVIMSPILSVYGISQSFHTVSLREVAFILVDASILVLNRGKIKKNQITSMGLILVSYIFFVATAYPLLGINEFSFLRVVRFLLQFGTIFILAPLCFDDSLGYRGMKLICILSTTFLFVQIFSFEFLGKYIPGYLTFLPIRQAGLVESTNYIINNMGSLLSARCSSFFEEPAYYAAYIAVFLCIHLWKRYEPLNRLLLVYLVLGAMLSTSVLGIAAVLLVGMMALISQKNISTKIKFSIIVIAVLAIIVAMNTSEFIFLIKKIFTVFSSLSNSSRFIGYKMYVSSFDEMNLVQILFGNCMSVQSLIIVAGYVVIPFYFGLIGYLLYGALVVKLISTSVHKGLLPAMLLVLFLNVGSGEFAMGISFMMVSAFVVSNDNSAGIQSIYCDGVKK